MRSNKKTSVNLDDSDCDQKEGYRNLTNQNTTDNSSYDNLEFINPVFKKHKDVQITDQNNYSTLARHHSLDDNKATEEVEMGIKNFGYMPERRPESWESSLSTEFHPYAIDTPIRHPSVGLEMTETGADNRLSTISKSSHYSAVKDNPYMIPAEKRNEYEDLAIMQAKYHRQIANGARAAGSKKANMVYEPAVVAERTAKYRKKSIASNGYEDNSSYCHLIFTILVALLAIIALIMVFMLLFGVINPKACSNCEVDPITSKQTQDPGNKINDQFELLKGNLSLLKQLEKSSSDMLVELNKQKSLVNLLTKELEVQKRLTSVLKNDVANITFIRGPQGIQGPMGFNGSHGDRGPTGPAGRNFSLCKYNIYTLQTASHASLTVPDKNEDADKIIVGVTCSSDKETTLHLYVSGDKYECKCTFVTTPTVTSKCSIHYWTCPG